MMIDEALEFRVIPTLLLRGEGLVKTTKFKDAKYLGDPINAVRIFNEKEVDEMIFLDINATPENAEPNYEQIADIASEAFMPFAYGGGIRTPDQAARVFDLGVEKIVLNSHALADPSLIETISKRFGAQSVVVAIDAKKKLLGGYEVMRASGQEKTGKNPVDWAKQAESLGAGEIFINSIDHDGMMKGYDIALTKQVAEAVNLPVIACGGAGSVDDFKAAMVGAQASAVSAGSFFVFHGKHKAVLITYPEREALEALYQSVHTES